MQRKLTSFFVALTAALALSVSTLSFAGPLDDESLDNQPSAINMAADALVARPLLLAATLVGTATYLVSLPFSLLGGNAGDAAQELVIRPAAATFVRCLGCEASGRKQKVVKVAAQ